MPTKTKEAVKGTLVTCGVYFVSSARGTCSNRFKVQEFSFEIFQHIIGISIVDLFKKCLTLNQKWLKFTFFKVTASNNPFKKTG